ncbi:hypothetical protein O7626_08500 [Micromonospora sp. WMMD1102]|nr:hypothetical protein [Micromonospora sp. WMMD1102]MDG4785963.1 hypothetical protein [Micromonospora sp. WMMD1102]
MKKASPGDAGPGLVGMAERAALHGGMVQHRTAATLKGSHS